MRLPLLSLALLCGSASGQYGVRRLPPVRYEAVSPDIPAADPDPEFPLRIHIFSNRWGGLSTRNHGYGSANLVSKTPPVGFDYAFECDYPFVQNQAPGDTYQARRKRESFELEVLTRSVDGKHFHTCKLQIAIETQPFTEVNVLRYRHGVSSSLQVPWQNPEFAYQGPTPDYPVQLLVIDGERREDREDHGWGIANLVDPDPLNPFTGADYTYVCSRGFLPNSQKRGFYPARWTKPGEQLEVLLQRPGSDKVDTCRVQIARKSQPYPER